jgi:CRP-like cAMP-binding protein
MIGREMSLPGARNLVLERMAPPDRARVMDDAEPVALKRRERLMEPGDKIENVYFPSSGVVSYATVLEDGAAVETCTAGYEGVVGAEMVLGRQTLVNTEIVVQIPGDAWAIPYDRFVSLCDEVASLDDAVRRHAQFMLVEAFQGVACNRMHALEQRLSRWLLMCHDRSTGDDLPLTQEFIATMLGVQRPTVTVTLGTLQQAGLIEITRGHLRVADREGLERASCECYESVQSMALRLFGEEPRNRGAGR